MSLITSPLVNPATQPPTPQCRGRRIARPSMSGTLVIDSVESEDVSPARDITFDPLILPNGIAPSDDPILSVRSATYSQSLPVVRQNSNPKRSIYSGDKKMSTPNTPARFAIHCASCTG